MTEEFCLEEKIRMQDDETSDELCLLISDVKQFIKLLKEELGKHYESINPHYNEIIDTLAGKLLVEDKNE